MNEYYPYYSTFLIVTLTISIPIYFQKMAEGGIGPTGLNSDTNLIHSSHYSRHSQASQKTMFASSTGAVTYGLELDLRHTPRYRIIAAILSGKKVSFRT